VLGHVIGFLVHFIILAFVMLVLELGGLLHVNARRNIAVQEIVIDSTDVPKMDQSLSALAPHVADAVVWHDGKSFHPGGFHSFSGIVGQNHVVPMSCKCEGVSCLWNAQFRLRMHGIGLRLTEVTQSALVQLWATTLAVNLCVGAIIPGLHLQIVVQFAVSVSASQS
jgi:hypothetical protein